IKADNLESELENIKSMELTIEDAVKIAKENSREMWKIDDGLKEIKESRKNAKDQKETVETMISKSLTEGFTPEEQQYMNNYVTALLSKNNYYITYADLKTKEIEKNREVINVGIEIETKSLYYQVLVTEKTIEINEGNLNKAKEQLRVINLKFNNGTATRAEVLNGEMAVQRAQTELDSSIDDLEMAKLNLLNKLDLPFDMELTLTDKNLEYVPISDIDLKAVIEKAKTDRPEILTANNDLELQKIETHAYTAYYTSNLRQHKSAVEKLKDAELNVPKVYKNVELDVRKTYLNLVKAERAILNMDKTVEIAKEAARINKLLYDNGMTTSLDVLEADTNLAQAEISRYQLLVSYNINKMMFDNCNLIGSK
ncbi:MAG: TolC family protein, partial [Tissierellia bacterium]|nr:TolC family protein [Tissierellia bacterium]